MYASTQWALQAYTSVGVETGVMEADPHKLILMLFDGAIAAIAAARGHMQQKDIARKGEAISKAITIIDHGLKASLDQNAGGKLAQDLNALYEYMCNRLLLANLKNQPQALDEVNRLLTELKTAWESIGQGALTGQNAY